MERASSKLLLDPADERISRTARQQTAPRDDPFGPVPSQGRLEAQIADPDHSRLAQGISEGPLPEGRPRREGGSRQRSDQQAGAEDEAGQTQCPSRHSLTTRTTRTGF